MATARETARRKRQSTEATSAKSNGGARRLIVAVTTDDGKTERLKITPYQLGLAEMEFPESNMLQVLYGAFVAKGEPGGDFDKWAQTIVHAMSEDEAIPPTSSSGPGK